MSKPPEGSDDLDEYARQGRRLDDLPRTVDVQLPALGGPIADPPVRLVGWNDHGGAFVTLEIDLGGVEPIEVTFDALDAARFAEAVDDAAAAAEAFADEWAETQVEEAGIRAKEVDGD